MKKAIPDDLKDELLPEYDLDRLKGGTRGKYAREAAEEPSNLVLIEPALSKIFPDSAAVNRALRLLVKAGAAARTPPRRQSSGSR